MLCPISYLLIWSTLLLSVPINTDADASNLLPGHHKLLDSLSDPDATTLAGRGHYTYISEVSRPIIVPKSSKTCAIVTVVRNHDFRWNSTPYNTVLRPPKICKGSRWTKVKLNFQGKGHGTQFSQIFDVFLDGLQLFRSSTPNLFRTRTAWSFDADVTKYSAFFSKKRSVTVTLPTLLSVPDPGYFTISLVLTFYSGGGSDPRIADVIVPVSARSKGFAAFSITNASNSVAAVLTGLPRNAYRASLEIITTPTGPDQLLSYSTPREYSDDIPFLPSNGVFREVQVSVDGKLAGAVFPKTVVYPSLLFSEYWSWFVGIGVYGIPSYFLEVTPFIGQLTNGKSHRIGFKVPEVSVGSKWYTSAILHIWLDRGRAQTTGRLISRQVAPTASPRFGFKYSKNRLNVNVTVAAGRTISVVGSVSTSFGNYTCRVSTQLQFRSSLRTIGRAEKLYSSQVTSSRVNVSMYSVGKGGRAVNLYSSMDTRSYPLQTSVAGFTNLNGTFSQKFDLVFLEVFGKRRSYYTSVKNDQRGTGFESTFAPGEGDIKQTFNLVTNYEGCYSRRVSNNVDSVYLDKTVRMCQ